MMRICLAIADAVTCSHIRICYIYTCVFMLFAARKFMRIIRAKLAEERRRNAAATKLQCLYRQRCAWLRLLKLARERDFRLRMDAANAIQRTWRGAKGRHIYAIMRGLMQLRMVERGAAVRLQTAWRVFKSKRILFQLRELEKKHRFETKMATQIQKVWRGLRGRQKMEIRRNLAALKAISGPLQDEVRVLEHELLEVRRSYMQIRKQIEYCEDRFLSWSREYDKIKAVKAKEVDSDKVTGTTQRFETAFLRRALRTQIKAMRRNLEKLQSQREEVVFRLHDIDRRLRGKRRDLIPLEKDVITTTLDARKQRFADRQLRDNLAAAKIQALYRARTIRKAIRAGTNYWVQMQDEATGTPYYYNLWTEVSRWTRPIEFDLYDEGPTKHKTGWTQAYDEQIGSFYYYNTDTGEYRWDRPEEMGAEADSLYTGQPFTSQDKQSWWKVSGIITTLTSTRRTGCCTTMWCCGVMITSILFPGWCA